MQKSNIIASIIEGTTYCYFNQLLEDEGFNKLFINLLAQNKSIENTVKTLMTYINKNELV